MAVNLFTGATSDSWAVATNWSLGAVPTATDGHVATLDATSPNCDLTGSNRVANALNLTGFTGTLSFGPQLLSVAGDITLSPTATYTGVGGSFLLITATGTMTWNGTVFPVGFIFSN